MDHIQPTPAQVAHLKKEITNMHTPLISVMVPTCERSTYLRETITSILAADLGEERMEICIVDNNSKNHEIRQIVESLGAGRIKFLEHSERVAPAQNWNRCWSNASGDWVHILHDDDLVRPHTYRRLLESFSQKDITIICGSADIINGHSAVCGRIELGAPHDGEPDQDFLARLCVKNRIPVSSVFLRREFLEKIGGFDESMRYCFDWKCWIIAMFSGGKIIADTLSQYRVHSQNDGTNPIHQFHAPAELLSTAKLGAELFKKKYGKRINALAVQSEATAFIRGWLIQGARKGNYKTLAVLIKATFRLRLICSLLISCLSAARRRVFNPHSQCAY